MKKTKTQYVIYSVWFLSNEVIQMLFLSVLSKNNQTHARECSEAVNHQVSADPNPVYCSKKNSHNDTITGLSRSWYNQNDSTRQIKLIKMLEETHNSDSSDIFSYKF